jgi:hypothetical protein
MDDEGIHTGSLQCPACSSRPDLWDDEDQAPNGGIANQSIASKMSLYGYPEASDDERSVDDMFGLDL